MGPTEYSFAAVAAPYAQELLDVQTARTFALGELGKQVSPVRISPGLTDAAPPLHPGGNACDLSLPCFDLL